ncbi:hypothetical protein MTR67_036960 [Solanum verrucosum]|uniref:Uncharacterized protein n=1 Tax=Solanum verrucosum TaxID=315347 RepID=A0AAF0UD22_SOLVR|nr:hypothetical protein MTR67_036960 [Solanum verrucosum]
MSSQIIHGAVTITSLKQCFLLTAVYGLHIIDDRRGLWEELLILNTTILDLWLVFGGFKAMTCLEDRASGNPVHEYEVHDFNKYIITAGMIELRGIGRWFTWTNGYVYSKIDRALVNAAWTVRLEQNEVMVMDPGCSDHTPLSVQFTEEEVQRPKPFRFLNCLSVH